MRKRFLFICGCPRSGTTALWSLITAHEEYVIGVERYGNRFFDPGFFDTSHFEKERFFDNQGGDTFYDDLSRFNNYYPIAEQRYDNAHVIGDKIPTLYKYFEKLNRAFPDAVVLMIFRNIFDVAASYKARAENESDETWSRSKGVESALEDWTTAIAAYQKWSGKMEIVPVDYESLFIEGRGYPEMFNQAGLTRNSQTDHRFQSLLARSAQLESRRPRSLTAMEVKHISVTAPFGGYRSIVQT